MRRSSGSTPSSSWMAELLTLSLREEAHFSGLYPGSRCFGHDPKFMAIGEGRNVDRLVNRELRFSAQLSLHHNGPAHHLPYCDGFTDPFVDLPLHSSLIRIAKVFVCLHLHEHEL
ncbi:hypothetical protein CHARACLAT_019721 [Characodon lateralis]|uniref:Uncharacterized protein n=1 Tax=Characodon lateralis TaxID=208331 RepID=A0ABU7EKL9_9TELE|nr:hypothetical protein [Characodon lateralis]